MTVRELLEQLETVDPESEVIVQAAYSGNYTDLLAVEVDRDTQEVKLHGRD